TLKMILIGLGMGPTLPLFPLIVQNASRPEDVGVVTAGAMFSRSLGQVIGLALFGTVFATGFASTLDARVGGIVAGLPPAAREAVARSVPAFSANGEGAEIACDPGEAGDRDELALNGGRSDDGPDRVAAIRAVDEIREAFEASLTG